MSHPPFLNSKAGEGEQSMKSNRPPPTTQQSKVDENVWSSDGADSERDTETKADAGNYERLRLERIRENANKLQALGLPALVASFPTLSKPSSSRPTKRDKDADYQPSESEDGDREEDDVDDEKPRASKSYPLKRNRQTPRGKKMKSLTTLSSSHASSEEKHKPFPSHETHMDDDDDIVLQQALALSIGATVEDAIAIAEASRKDSVTATSKYGLEDSQPLQKGHKPAKNKRHRFVKKSAKTVKLSDEEALAYFLLFDDTGKGKLTMQDLERVVATYDFTWSKQEIKEMISVFDKDRDNKLCLEEFRMVLECCNMVGSQ